MNSNKTQEHKMEELSEIEMLKAQDVSKEMFIAIQKAIIEKQTEEIQELKK